MTPERCSTTGSWTSNGRRASSASSTQTPPSSRGISSEWPSGQGIARRAAPCLACSTITQRDHMSLLDSPPCLLLCSRFLSPSLSISPPSAPVSSPRPFRYPSSTLVPSCRLHLVAAGGSRSSSTRSGSKTRRTRPSLQRCASRCLCSSSPDPFLLAISAPAPHRCASLQAQTVREQKKILEERERNVDMTTHKIRERNDELEKGESGRQRQTRKG